MQDQGFSVEAICARFNIEAMVTGQSLSISFHTSRTDNVLVRKDLGLVVIICPPSQCMLVRFLPRIVTTREMVTIGYWGIV